MTGPARLLAAPVHLYRLLAAGRLSPCRFVPSCSTYALEALEAHGAVRGGWLALRRLLRCRPYARAGYDPVPSPHTADDRGAPCAASLAGEG